MSLEELTLPFLDPRKRVAEFPQPTPTVPPGGAPTTAGTGSEVSPAAVITVGRARRPSSTTAWSPDIAIVDPILTLTMPPASPPTPGSTR